MTAFDEKLEALKKQVTHNPKVKKLKELSQKLVYKISLYRVRIWKKSFFSK